MVPGSIGIFEANDIKYILSYARSTQYSAIKKLSCLPKDGFSFFFFCTIKIDPVSIAKLNKLLENKFIKWNEVTMWILCWVVGMSQWI